MKLLGIKSLALGQALGLEIKSVALEMGSLALRVKSLSLEMGSLALRIKSVALGSSPVP